MTIARPSRVSLLLTPCFGSTPLAAATGFLVNYIDDVYLVTLPARYDIGHVVTGRHPNDGSVLDKVHGGIPDRLSIAHNRKGGQGRSLTVDEPLYDDEGKPLWRQHPRINRRRVDVVALPLTRSLTEIEIHAHDPFAQPRMGQVSVADQVSIIGFPFGVTAGGSYGVWTQGTVASEPDVDYEEMPVFLVDSRTRTGLSGAPVIVYSNGGLRRNDDTSVTVGGPPVERFLGVYAGRINEQSDLGRVWKSEVLGELFVNSEPGEDGS